MDEQEIIKLNKKRLNVQLKPLRDIIKVTPIEKIKNYKIFRDGKEYKMDDIDFKKSIIFICDTDFSAYISYYGMLKANNVVDPDKSLSGVNSMIRTSYKIVNSLDIKLSRIPLTDLLNDNRDDLKEERELNGLSLWKKDILIWRLFPGGSAGMGDDKKMFDCCYSWVLERFCDGKIDWLFYFGTIDKFEEEYDKIAKMQIPVYNIIMKSSKKKRKNNIEQLGEIVEEGEVF